MPYETLLTEFDEDTGVAVIQMNRPDALNALSEAMMNDLTSALDRCDQEDKVGCVILTGSKKAFSGGADIKEIKDKTFPESYYEDFISRNWERTARLRKPIIAAVSGYAVGGGCELALMCDIILAADNAKFGQPEIALGVIPGMGGTQRLIRAVGKSRAMELVLTGKMFSAQDAEKWGKHLLVFLANAFSRARVEGGAQRQGGGDRDQNCECDRGLLEAHRADVQGEH